MIAQVNYLLACDKFVVDRGGIIVQDLFFLIDLFAIGNVLFLLLLYKVHIFCLSDLEVLHFKRDSVVTVSMVHLVKFYQVKSSD